MLEIHVKKNDGDFSTITEAIWAVPYDTEAVIYIGEGAYHEKLFSDKRNISFIGEGMDKTVIEYGDGAFDEMEDGSKRGTFRSFTAFFTGEKCTVKKLTIKNTAGDGAVAGQALAVYADARYCHFEDVRLEGHQDTLFLSPLPKTERQKNGFLGPRVKTARVLTRQYYKNCEISGDIDFIFGGADAVFDNCLITCNHREADNGINGYITAASGDRDNLGFVFRNCIVKGESGCEAGSVFLGRPWRDEARTAFLDCRMDDTIAKERFSGWGNVDKSHPDTFYCEYNSRSLDGDAELSLRDKNPWVKEINADDYKHLSLMADKLIEEVATFVALH